jgi:hypothetical protein
MKKANALMRAYIDTHKGLEFVEVGPPMLGADASPNQSCSCLMDCT